MAAHAFIQMTAPIYGSLVACARLMPCNIRGFLPYGKHWMMPKQRGYRHLEFMDVGLPFRKHGYREFVLRFGGKQSSTRRWFRFRWNWLNRVLIKMYE